MKNKNYINHIVRDFLDGKLDPKQRKKFLEMTQKNIVRSELEHTYQSIFEQIESLSDADVELLQLLLQQEQKSKGIIHLIKPLIKYAAVFVMLLGLYFAYQWVSTSDHSLLTNSRESTPITHILPDGSEIKLLANSSFDLLEYNERSRSVLLHGEAEFTVVPNKTPFFVKTKSQYFTKVLGTKFSVKNLTDKYQVSVQRGRVSVGRGEDILGILSIGDSLVVDDHIHLYSSGANPLLFDGMKLKHVIHIINQTYDSDVQLAEDLDDNVKCTAVFEKHLSIVEIVEILCEMYGYTYTINKQKIIIQS